MGTVEDLGTIAKLYNIYYVDFQLIRNNDHHPLLVNSTEKVLCMNLRDQ